MVTRHAWVTAVPEWPHCVAALGGDETLGLAGLLVILERDGAQGVLPPSWPKARLGAQGGDPGSLWPIPHPGWALSLQTVLSQGCPSQSCVLPSATLQKPQLQAG